MDQWKFKASDKKYHELNERVWVNPFFFVVLADTQLGLMENNENWEEEKRLSELAVVQINKLMPKFAIVCGDMINHIPELYPKQDPNLREVQIKDFKNIWKNIKVPLVCVCGNHDVGNSPTSSTIERYRNDFGDDYFSFWAGGVKCIVLNSSAIHSSQHVKEYNQEQLNWLKTELEDALNSSAVHTYVFLHHPLFLESESEGEDLGKLSWVQNGQTYSVEKSYFHIKLDQRIELLEIFKNYNVKYVFSGHFHKNNIAHSEKYGITNITTSAVGVQLGSDKSGIRLVSVDKENTKHKYYEIEQNIPENIDF
eukprot:TRINITY_DN4020_c0_g1_i1.p1 TRINITY_DN4020_c0_g1~~TRINITY_DN4020_c0_g1_i1.p1  ORF type:complete len:310 (-),score=68.60 TRINITY_DN4020_c0_g1_i1:200-1129(-)